MFEICAFGV